jgi:hypothetical protein
MNISSALFHSNHNSYGCHPTPIRPLTLPVKFVVPPRTDSLLSDPSRQLCFEENSDVNVNKLTNNEHCKKICIDNYSRIIFERNNSRRYISEYFQDIYINNLPRNLSTYNHHELTDSDKPCTDIITDKRPRKNSYDDFEKLYNADDKSEIMPNGVYRRRSISKDMLTQQRIADEISTKTQRNIQRFLVNPLVSVLCHKQNCEKKKCKLLTPRKLESNAPKMTAASPLDLTKLK